MAVAALPESIEEWTQEQRDSLLAIAERTLASYGKYNFSHDFIARHVDDFVQDALLQAWVSQQDPEAEALRIYNPAGFVSFKVVQLALDKAKGERRRLERAAPESIGANEPGAFETAAERVSDPIRTDEVAELVEHLQATKLAMSQLAERQRIAFVKCQLEGRSQTEVAEALSETSEQPVTRKAVERLVANARVSLSVAFSKVASGAFCEEQRKLLELVDNGWATPEQEQQAHAHLEDCPQCAQVRAFARFERDAGLAAITLPGFGAFHPATATGLLGSVQHVAGGAGERAREFVARIWPFSNGTEAGGAAMGTVTTTKAIVAICLAAGGTGACVKAFSAVHRNPKPSTHRQRASAQQASASIPVIEAEQPSEVTVSPSPETGNRSARRGEKPHLLAARRSTAKSTAAGGGGEAKTSEAQQEFGFEGGSSSGASTGGGSSGATPSTVSSSTASAGGGESSSSPAPAPSPAPTSSGSGGGHQAQQEFGIGP